MWTSVVKVGGVCQVSGALYDLELAAIDIAAEAEGECTEDGIRGAILTVVSRLCHGGSSDASKNPSGFGAEKPPPEWDGSSGLGEPELPDVAEERGVLRVEGTPRTARVELTGPRSFGTNGALATSLPYGPANVPAGDYRVQVSAPEHDSETRTVTVYADRTEVVAVALVPSNGVLELGGSPAGAKVDLTCQKAFMRTFGLPAAMTPIPVPRGACRVQVERNGYEFWDRAVEVGGGATVRHEVKLAQIPEGTAADRGGLTWIRIPGGTFDMGSSDWEDGEKPMHRVKVRTFWMTKSEVTVAQYRACVNAGVCTVPACSSDGDRILNDLNNWHKSNSDNLPVNCVDWSQAAAFSKWAGGRLPTEAEWEYAARSGGKARKWPWGDEHPTCERVVMENIYCGCNLNRSWPVCSKTAGNTDHQLCDMAGNVMEWVQDGYHENYRGAPKNGGAWERKAGSSRVIRGGSYCADYDGIRTTYRSPGDPGEPTTVVGFRLARSIAP